MTISTARFRWNARLTYVDLALSSLLLINDTLALYPGEYRASARLLPWSRRLLYECYINNHCILSQVLITSQTVILFVFSLKCRPIRNKMNLSLRNNLLKSSFDTNDVIDLKCRSFQKSSFYNSNLRITLRKVVLTT